MKDVRLYVDCETNGSGVVDLGPYFFRSVRAARAFVREQRFARIVRWSIWKNGKQVDTGP